MTETDAIVGSGRGVSRGFGALVLVWALGWGRESLASPDARDSLPSLPRQGTSEESHLYRRLDSLVLANRMGAARDLADSLLPWIPASSPYRDSVQAKRSYLEDLLTRRTRPPSARARAWSLQTEFVVGWESFRWVRGRSEWARTREESWDATSGTLADPSASLPFQAQTGASAGLEASGSWDFATGPLGHRWEVSGRWGFSREDSLWNPRVSWVAPRAVATWGLWEASLDPAWQWSGGDLVSAGASTAISRRTRDRGRPWILSLEGGVQRLVEQKLTYRQVGARIAHHRPLWGGWGRVSLEGGWMDRTGVEPWRGPVRVASCADLQAGESASATSLVCYASPTSDSVVAPHPFKGLSGYPYRPGPDLVGGSWTSALRAGFTVVLWREFARRRYNLQGMGALGVVRSLDPVRWNNGHFGNALGDSLYVYQDRATGTEYLWERDFRSRFLQLKRREEPLLSPTVAGQIRGGFRPVAPLELHLECIVGRTWSSLPDEAEVRGFFRWQFQGGAGWQW